MLPFGGTFFIENKIKKIKFLKKFFFFELVQKMHMLNDVQRPVK